MAWDFVKGSTIYLRPTPSPQVLLEGAASACLLVKVKHDSGRGVDPSMTDEVWRFQATTSGFFSWCGFRTIALGASGYVNNQCAPNFAGGDTLHNGTNLGLGVGPLYTLVNGFDFATPELRISFAKDGGTEDTATSTPSSWSTSVPAPGAVGTNYIGNGVADFDRNMDGAMQDWALYKDYVLTERDRRMYHDGYSPLFIEPGSLAAYADGFNNEAAVGTVLAVVGGTLPQRAHLDVHMPFGGMVG